MPGIAGIIDFSGIMEREGREQDINRMSNILSHSSSCSTEKVTFEAGTMAAVFTANSSLHGLIAEDELNIIAFWGCLWDEGELRRKSDWEFQSLKEISAGELALRIYRKSGIDGLCNLNGRFVAAIWEKKERRLRLVSDRHGSATLYYRTASNRIFFASEYKAIVGQDDFQAFIDEQGLADFLALGYCTGDRTLFEKIKLVPEASVATFEVNKSPSLLRYWDYSFYTDDDPVWTEDDYIEHFFDKLKIATQRQLVNAREIALPLSGGYDSRALAAMLNNIGFAGSVEAVSFGNPDAFDVVYGKRIAKNLGFNHSYIPIETSYLQDQAERFVWLMDGAVNCLNAHMLLMFPFIEKHQLGTVITGFFGDIICGSAAWIYSLGVRGGTDDEEIFRRQYDVHANIMNDEEMAKYAKENFYKRIKGGTFETLRARYFNCPSRNRYYRSRYFSIHERQRRYTAFNLHVFDSIAEVVAPFLDREFVEFALHVPSSLIINQNCYRKMIIRHLPKVATVPHNETRLPLNASWIRKGFQWRWERLNKNQLVRSTIGRKYSRMNDNYLNSEAAIRTGSKNFVTRHIKGNQFLAEYFNMDQIHLMLDDHMGGKNGSQGKITALLTLSLWHKLFVDGEGFKHTRVS